MHAKSLLSLVGAERNNEKIAVEIKSFLATSTISEFHTAIGQYINYRYALEEQEAERSLYLAIPLNTYQDFFKRQFIQSVIQRSKVNILVYNIEKNGTEDDVAEMLVKKGVAKDDIVIGFHPPLMRQYTEYAVD